jgi:methyl-accepting chemotaxis protein
MLNPINSFNRLSFKTRAIAIAVLLTTLPALGTGLFAASLSADNFQKNEISEKQLIAKSLSDNLSRFIGLRAKDIQNVALATNFTDATKVAKTPLAEQEQLLTKYSLNYGLYREISLVDLTGTTVATSKGGKIANYAQKSYFQAAINNKKPQISAVDTSGDAKNWGVDIAAPCLDSAGKVVAVIHARMPLSSLSSVARTFGDSDNRWSIFDANSKKIVFAADENLIGQTTDTYPTFNQYPIGQNIIRTIEDTNGASKKRQLVSYATIPPTTGITEAKLVGSIAQDLETIAAGELRIYLAIGIGVLLAGGVAAALALLASDRLSKYLQTKISGLISSSTEISNNLQAQDTTITNQANSALMATGTVNQLGEISAQAANQAEFSAQGAQTALSIAAEGAQAVQQSIRGMAELEAKVNDIADRVNNLGEQTRQISTVAALVADLANQTNMLALKAAVEASHAGEQGKGFSVVAGEIRKLADRSKKSAQQIDTLAGDIQIALDTTVMSTAEGTKTVATGVHLAETTAAKFIGVTAAIDNIFVSSRQIANNSQQQAQAVQDVLNTMRTIALESQESAVGIHRVKSSTEELTQIATELKAVMN